VSSPWLKPPSGSREAIGPGLVPAEMIALTWDSAVLRDATNAGASVEWQPPQWRCNSGWTSWDHVGQTYAS